MVAPVSKLPHLETTIFTTMGQLAVKHQAVNLSQGFPNFDPDPYLLELVGKALKARHNQYAPMQGVYELREAIGQKISSLYNAHYDPSTEIVVTAGATQAIFTAIAAFIKPGDEVIVFKPAYDCYEPAIALQGGVVVPIALGTEGPFVDWQVVQASITPSTKMIIINSPHNPSGNVFTKQDMLQLEALLEDSSILLLSDEVYEHLVYDGETHESASKYPALKERALVCASFGKTFHVTGWKIGYIAGPKSLMEEFNKVHQYNVFCVNHPMQVALATYLKDEQHYLGLAAFYQEKRDYFMDAIAPSRFKGTPSQGTYFQVLNYAEITDEPAMDFAKRLIKNYKIASIPMAVFNLHQKDHKELRFCFAKTQETLAKAADILNKI